MCQEVLHCLLCSGSSSAAPATGSTDLQRPLASGRLQAAVQEGHEGALVRYAEVAVPEDVRLGGWHGPQAAAGVNVAAAPAVSVLLKTVC
jgi:hypothetical protein